MSDKVWDHCADLDRLSAAVRDAKQAVEMAKMKFRFGDATYDDMADAAKRLSGLMYDYQKAKFPQRRPVRIPYQAILR